MERNDWESGTITFLVFTIAENPNQTGIIKKMSIVALVIKM